MAKYFVLSRYLKIYDAIFFISYFSAWTLAMPFVTSHHHHTLILQWGPSINQRWKARTWGFPSQPIMESLMLSFESVFFCFFCFFLHPLQPSTKLYSQAWHQMALLKKDIVVITSLCNQNKRKIWKYAQSPQYLPLKHFLSSASRTFIVSVHYKVDVFQTVSSSGFFL